MFTTWQIYTFLRGIKVWNVSALDMGYSTAQGRFGLKNGEYNTLILFECLLADITRLLSAWYQKHLVVLGNPKVFWAKVNKLKTAVNSQKLIELS